LLPILNQLAISFSSGGAAMAGKVGIWPVNFTLDAYKYMATKPAFFMSLKVSLLRVLVAVPFSLIIAVLAAYPLSKRDNEFKARKFYIWYFVITMLFSGGLIPTYMMVSYTGLMNSFWALVIPYAVNSFNIILLMNFFRSLPKELEEAAYIDGASEWRVLWSIILPLSKPALATVALFFMVNHWNSWFDGLIFMSSPEKYPLQTYLQTTVISRDLMTMEAVRNIRDMVDVTDKTGKAAQIFLAAVPILCVYPFLQKYFTTGVVMGSVKG
jgi:putative aldouronate transport system permease protein